MASSDQASNKKRIDTFLEATLSNGAVVQVTTAHELRLVMQDIRQQEDLDIDSVVFIQVTREEMNVADFASMFHFEAADSGHEPPDFVQ